MNKILKSIRKLSETEEKQIYSFTKAQNFDIINEFREYLSLKFKKLEI